VLLACASVTAQERDGDQDDRPRFNAERSEQRAIEPSAAPAVAPNARLVVLVRAPDGRVVLEKGVRSVERIARGVYCIRPDAASGIDPANAVVVVSVEYYYSLYDEVKVQWARRENGCGRNRIGVYTLADENLNGVYSFSNAVGFVAYVP
jgi:hypothetical protein